MANPPDYAAIQSLWIQTWQARPELETVRQEIIAAEKALADGNAILETARPTFKKANPGLWVDSSRLTQRLAYYREIINGDASSYPAIHHAMIYGLDGLEDFDRMLPEGAIQSLAMMGLAPRRGDVSAATGFLYTASEGMDGWLESVWDSWFLATLIGYPAEVLTEAGYELDAEVVLRELTGKNRKERAEASLQTAGLVFGVLASVVGIAVGVRQWRKERAR